MVTAKATGQGGRRRRPCDGQLGAVSHAKRRTQRPRRATGIAIALQIVLRPPPGWRPPARARGRHRDGSPNERTNIMRTEDWHQKWLAEQQRRRDRLPAVKQRLCAALKARGIARVVIGYDGEGDSGQIDTIEARGRKGGPVRLDRPITIALGDADQPTRYEALEAALDAFAWLVLQAFHRGFENDDGGYGTIRIDVAKAKLTLDHNDRLVQVEAENTVTEV
jgi:hypothetical protein